MDAWDRLRQLPLHVTHLRWERLALPLPGNWTRATRLLTLGGPAGKRGHGEDVSWVEVPMEELDALYPAEVLEFDGTLGDWSARLDAHEQSPAFTAAAADRQSEPDFLRWAVESAGMELALHQSETSLAEVLGREATALRFCLSMGLGSPPSTERLRGWLGHGGYRFKLDASPAWDEPTVSELAALDCVDVVDMKAYYQGTRVDNPVDAGLYQRVADGLPEVVLEDLLPNDETLPLLRANQQRLAWDAPIHAFEDLDDVVPDGIRPGYLNIKPSRFGTWRKLLAAYDGAARAGMRCYGGGQFELGHGRAQIQALAALFHPDAANDVAPLAFHTAEPQPGMPVDRIPLDEIPRTSLLRAYP